MRHPYSSAAHLNTRQRDILTAVVEQYVQTGEPVASQAVAAALQVSSATVRNAMVELADKGYLEQPHTSSGRIPTAQAFRLHVDQLRGGDRLATAYLPEQSRSQIDSHLSGVAGAQAFLERTSHVLAALSRGVGVALTSANAGDLLEHVHFQRLATRKALAVVVTRSGVVRDRVLQLGHDLSAADLETAARYLNENFRGWSVELVRAELRQRADQERDEYQRMVQAAGELWSHAVPADGVPVQTVYVEGVANLIGGESDRVRLREMLVALEAKERLVALLNAYINAKQGAVRVIFDLEAEAPEMQGLVLVAAPAMMDGAQLGTVGVIGLQRMNYQNTINAVEYVAQLFTQTQQPGGPA